MAEPAARLSSPGEPATGGPIDLIEAQHAHSIIDVEMPATKQIFQSAILAVDADARTLAIDALFPAGSQLKAGMSINVTLRLACSKRIRFSTRVLETRTHGDGESYRIAMPGNFTYNQRRESYRFRLAQTFAEFYVVDNYYCAGTIEDISLTGMRIALEHKIGIDIGDVLKRLTFGIGGQSIHCDGLVKHCYRNVAGNDIIGIEFHAMPRQQQRALERFLFQMHRARAKQIAEQRVENNVRSLHLIH